MGRIPECTFVVVLHLAFIAFVLGNEIDPNYALYHTNSCEKSGKGLSCDDGYVIKIRDVRCMPHNYTCSEREKIARLCDGLKSCSKIGLRRQLHYYCKNHPPQEVVTSFQCVRETTRPICRTNLCSDESKDPKCKRGKVLHVLSAKCYHGIRNCNSDIYLALYRLCEGQRSCSVSTLKRYFPPSTCNSTYVQQQNVFLDYICVNKSIVADRCTGTFTTIQPRFGILTNPGYPYNPNGSDNGCYWAIYPQPGQEVDVFVHLAYSEEGRDDCNSRFLQVQYTVCETKHQKTDRFCDEGRVNAYIHSCGTVYVMHFPYKPGEQRGNRFLVSYHVKAPSASVEAYEPYTHQCDRPDQNAGSARYTNTGETTPYITTEPYISTETEKNDIPLSDGSMSASDVQASKTPTNIKKSDPWRMVTLLRVVVVNIFLGLLIIALIMALVFVCYRYKTYGRDKKKPLSSNSNTATTLADKNSTEMQLLPDEEHDGSLNKELTADKMADSLLAKDQERVQSRVPYQTVPQFDKQLGENVYYSCSTGVSSFLPNKGDYSDSTYSTLDPADDTSPCPANPRNTFERSMSPGSDTQQNIRDSLQHYRIGDDGYAVVVKSQKRPNSETDSLKRDNKNLVKPVAHIHPVPDEEYQNSMSKTTMHMIPKHDCLLQRCPPPPPKPTPGINSGYWGSPEHDPNLYNQGHHHKGHSHY